MAAAGSFAEWFKLTGLTTTPSVSGIDIVGGYISLVIAALAAVFAAIALARARVSGGRAWSITSLCFALFGMLFGVGVVGSPGSSYATLQATKAAAETGVDPEVIDLKITTQILNGSLVVEAGPGGTLVMLGGLVGAAGAIVAIASAGKYRRSAAAVIAPPGYAPHGAYPADVSPPLPPPPG